MPPNERSIRNPLPLPEIVCNPALPSSLNLVDQLLQSVSLLTAMRGLERRLLKVDHGDRLKVCQSGQEANRVTQTRFLAIALPATVVLQPDTVAWAIATTGGGVEVDPQDAAAASYGAFTIQNTGVWEMHIPCNRVELLTSAWTAAACTHVAIIEWRLA